MSSEAQQKESEHPPGAARRGRKNLRLRRGERGVALLLVLWLMALLSVMALSFSGTTRIQARIARNLQDNAQARWLADAGVRLAIRRIWLAQTAEEAEDRSARAETRVCRLDRGVLAISVQNVAGLIDLNIASPDMLARLFAAAGLEEADAVRLAANVADFRDTNDRKRADGAEAEDYAAAGLPHRPKNGAFRAVEELEQVMGMTPDVMERVRGVVTVHSRRQVPDLRYAPPLVRRSFGQIPEPAEGRLLLDGEEGIFRITATAKTDSGAWFRRGAVLFIRGGPWPARRTLNWAPAPGHEIVFPERRELPPC